MSNYVQSTNFATKDALTSGDPLKIVKGTEINTEFVNIAVAVATKADLASPTFTGTTTITNVNITGGSITGITDLAVVDGGTGASTAANARTNLSAAASGANSDITSLSAITTPLSVAQGGTGSATLTANNVILGNGTSAVQVVAPSTSKNVLTSNGTSWSSSAPGQLQYNLYTSGATTFTAPAGVTSIKVICIGGGGGGGNHDSGGPANGGNGGNGGIAIGIYTVVPGTGYVATVGAGGAGTNTASTNGSAGATSSLGSLLSATGGSGGVSGNSGGADGAAGAGTSGVTANSSVFYGAGGDFVGSSSRANGASATAAVTWTAALNRVPGATGAGGTTSSNSSGGTGGAVYIEYIG